MLRALLYVRMRQTHREKQRIEAIMVFNLRRDTGKMRIYKMKSTLKRYWAFEEHSYELLRMTNESNGKRT